jgi:hypothetical protein
VRTIQLRLGLAILLSMLLYALLILAALHIAARIFK